MRNCSGMLIQDISTRTVPRADCTRRNFQTDGDFRSLDAKIAYEMSQNIAI